MILTYDHPDVPTVYTTELPDNADEDEVRARLLMLAGDAHASQEHARLDEDALREHLEWVAAQAAEHGTVER